MVPRQVGSNVWPGKRRRVDERGKRQLLLPHHASKVPVVRASPDYRRSSRSGLDLGRRRRSARASRPFTRRLQAASSALSEEIWKTAPLVRDFVQRRATEEAPSPVRRLSFVSHSIRQRCAVKVRAFDREPGKIAAVLDAAATRTRRRTGSGSSSTRITTAATAYEFVVNPPA